MAMYGEHPPLKLAKDPSDPVWFWFICNGPHGERFSWVREFSHAPGDLSLLEEFIDEKVSFDPEFKNKARTVALLSLDIANVAMVRKAIQVLCIIGKEKDMELIKELVYSDNEEIVKDAKCCLFERKIKFKI